MPTLLRLPVVMLAAVLTCAATIREAAAAPIPTDIRSDVYGDRLPPNAIARIGTVRLRSPNAFRSPREKLHAGTGYYGLPVRLPTEQGLVALSPNGRLLVTTGDYGLPLYVWNAESGQLLRTIKTFEYKDETADDAERVWLIRESVRAMAFAPDSREVRAMTNRGILRACDVTTGKWSDALANTGLTRKERESENWLATPLAGVSPDGTHFAFAPRAKPYRVEVFAVGKSKPLLQLKDQKFGGDGQ